MFVSLEAIKQFSTELKTFDEVFKFCDKFYWAIECAATIGRHTVVVRDFMLLSSNKRFFFPLLQSERREKRMYTNRFTIYDVIPYEKKNIYAAAYRMEKSLEIAFCISPKAVTLSHYSA